MTAVSLPAHLESLGQANEYLARILPEELRPLAPKIELALEELWVNIVNHGSPPAGRIELECRPAGLTGLTVSLKDQGPPFDPFTEAPEPDLTAAVAERPVGGLGLHLVKTLARDCRYRRLKGHNLVEIFFSLQSEAPDHADE